MLARLREAVRAAATRALEFARAVTRPRRLSGALVDLTRTRRELIAENALLRHQLVVLERGTKRPRLTRLDRWLLPGLARCTRSWSMALRIVSPDTVLRWHRAAFRFVWRRKSRPQTAPRSIDRRTIALIREMAAKNELWGAERIRGEPLRLGLRVSKRTVQKYMRTERDRPRGQSWSTFIANHRADTWACDFLQLHDVRFAPLFAFFIIQLDRRRVAHIGVTRAPSSEWVAQQLRYATGDQEGPAYLIRDRDAKFGHAFDRVAALTNIEVVLTAPRTPNMNAHYERFLGSVRRECLDHVIILGERHLLRVLREYVTYFNDWRPHQGLEQTAPAAAANNTPASHPITSRPVLGGLHHSYGRAA